MVLQVLVDQVDQAVVDKVALELSPLMLLVILKVVAVLLAVVVVGKQVIVIRAPLMALVALL
jgi:hypothetical protein